MSTPISAIRSQEQQHSFPPLPQIQQAPNGNQYNQIQQHMQHSSSGGDDNKSVDPIGNDSQKEITFLFIIVFLVSSEPVQRQLMTSFPALFNDSKSSIVANAINAGFICALFYFLRNVKVEF